MHPNLRSRVPHCDVLQTGSGSARMRWSVNTMKADHMPWFWAVWRLLAHVRHNKRQRMELQLRYGLKVIGVMSRSARREMPGSQSQTKQSGFSNTTMPPIG